MLPKSDLIRLSFEYKWAIYHERKVGEIFKEVEPEDLLKFGLIPEFIGRLPMIATLEDLDEKSLIKILEEPKNSLTKQYKELFKLDGAKLTFKDNALKEIAQKAINKNTGARGSRSILESILLKTMYELPSQNNVEEVSLTLEFFHIVVGKDKILMCL